MAARRGGLRTKMAVAPTEIVTPPLKKTILQPYATPTRSDMVVILVFYNPSFSIRIVHNLLFIKQKLEAAGIPTYTAELAYEEHPFVLPPSDTVFHYRSNSYLFYKENLINLVEKRIPAEYTKVCCLDADIVFSAPDWYDRVSELLDTHDVCQPFSVANWLDITYTKIVTTATSAVVGGHPGFAWACKRSLCSIGIFPSYALIGSGDSALTLFVMDKPIGGVMDIYAPLINEQKAARPKGLTVTSANNMTVYHLYHGSREKRQYGSRGEYIRTYLNSKNLSSLMDIVFVREDGLYEIRPQYLEGMNRIMRGYFTNRVDDSV
jgi:hypothetical protein